MPLDELIKCLTKSLEKLDLTLRLSTSNTKTVNVIIKAQNFNLDELRKIFEEEDPQINWIAHQFRQQTKNMNYYPKLTPPALRYEERNQII